MFFLACYLVFVFAISLSRTSDRLTKDRTSDALSRAVVLQVLIRRRRVAHTRHPASCFRIIAERRERVAAAAANGPLDPGSTRDRATPKNELTPTGRARVLSRARDRVSPPPPPLCAVAD